MKKEERYVIVPVWQKYILSVEEAAAYFGLGRDKVREMTDDPNSRLVLWNGSKRLIKRKRTEEFLDQQFSV